MKEEKEEKKVDGPDAPEQPDAPHGPRASVTRTLGQFRPIVSPPSADSQPPAPSTPPPQPTSPPAAPQAVSTPPVVPPGQTWWLPNPETTGGAAPEVKNTPPTPPIAKTTPGTTPWWAGHVPRSTPPVPAPTAPPTRVVTRTSSPAARPVIRGPAPPTPPPQAARPPAVTQVASAPTTPPSAPPQAGPLAAPPVVDALNSSEIKRNTRQLPPESVPRSFHSIHIGDLHGNDTIFVDTLINRGIIPASRKIEWTAGHAHLVLHGDIIGDRNLGGFKILKIVDELCKQAEAAGGKVTMIAGNHEATAIDFITGRDVGGMFIDSDLWFQSTGIVEFLRFANDPSLHAIRSVHDLNAKMIPHWETIKTIANQLISREKAATIWKNLSPPKSSSPSAITSVSMRRDNFLDDYRALRQELLTNMRKDAEGRKILERISKFNLCGYVDDAFHLHTELSTDIIKSLQQYGSTLGESVDAINAIFQQGLRHLLLDEGVLPSDWDHIYRIFTFTDNRDYHKDDGELSWLHEQGVNFVISGHSRTSTVDNANIEKTPSGVTLIGVDHGAGQSGQGAGSSTDFSAGTLLTNGTFVN